MTKKSKKELLSFEAWWWLGLVTFLLIFQGNHILNNDEGVVLDGAWSMLQGKELYVDFFEFVTPGSFYLVYFFWKIIGPYYWVANALGIGAVFLGALGIYKGAKLFSKEAFTLVPPAIFIFSSFHWPIINHNIFNTCALIWGAYFFSKGLKNVSVGNFLSSGFLIGLAILFLQHKGGVVFLVMITALFTLWMLRKKKVWKKSLIVFFVGTGVPLLFLFKWPIKLLYSNLVHFILFNYIETNKTPIYISLFFLFLLLLFALVMKKKRAILFLLFLQFVLLLTTFARSDNFHVGIVIFPLLILLPAAFDLLRNKKTIYKVAFCVLLFSSLWLITKPSIKYVTTFPLFYSIKNQGAIAYIKENCGETDDLYAGPFTPGLYYETGKVNQTSYSWLITNHQTPIQFEQAATQLAEKKPKCAALDYNTVRKFNYNKDNPVDRYIEENYEVVGSEGDLEIYEKKE